MRYVDMALQGIIIHNVNSCYDIHMRVVSVSLFVVGRGR